ncbi:hypothetical protein SAMD00019534_007690, partial [Acytostelium subglobosum LB1]|uniref:hypothetical protein n=1 Tax=Acytostelium subglobosum LB1 TaxID=1410327 RepID=UPI0006448838
MSFRFLGSGNSSPDQQLLNEVGYLSNLDDQQLSELIDIIFTFLLYQKAEGLMNSVSSFSQQHSISENALKNIIRGSIIFLKGAVKYHLTPNHVKEDLINFRLSEEQAESIALKYKTNFIDLSRSFVGNTFNINQVLDMQWRFGVTTASSESKKGGNTFLQLKLVLDKGGDTKEDVHMELTLPQFYQFLREMEKAKASLEYLN